MKLNTITFFIVIGSLFAACSSESENTDKQIIARVYDKYFYVDDLKGIIPEGLSESDSLKRLDGYIEVWITKQLIIKEAENALAPNEKDLQKQLEEYRSKLLIHKYTQKYINQKLDTIITEKEIFDVYNKRSKEFILNTNVVKARMIKIRSSASDISKVRYLYRSNNEANINKLKEICTQNAALYQEFEQDWVTFSQIITEINYPIPNQQKYLKKYSTIETKDSVFSYFVYIYDYKLINDISPLKFVKTNIKRIILTERKKKLVEELEKNIFINALNKNDFEVFL